MDNLFRQPLRSLCPQHAVEYRQLLLQRYFLILPLNVHRAHLEILAIHSQLERGLIPIPVDVLHNPHRLSKLWTPRLLKRQWTMSAFSRQITNIIALISNIQVLVKYLKKSKLCVDFLHTTDCNGVTVHYNNDCHDGDGNTVNCRIIDSQLCVKSVLSAVYSFSYTVTDSCGHSTTQQASVSVPSTNNGCRFFFVIVKI